MTKMDAVTHHKSRPRMLAAAPIGFFVDASSSYLRWCGFRDWCFLLNKSIGKQTQLVVLLRKIFIVLSFSLEYLGIFPSILPSLLPVYTPILKRASDLPDFPCFLEPVLRRTPVPLTSRGPNGLSQRGFRGLFFHYASGTATSELYFPPSLFSTTLLYVAWSRLTLALLFHTDFL